MYTSSQDKILKKFDQKDLKKNMYMYVIHIVVACWMVNMGVCVAYMS